ncbi:hypothetical protein A3715_03995 [Oleiphilus sp. HI0009]|uniref:glycosyltransferase n=1 Tax=Oleiphilus sp. HI0067 TaxID=1822243 RepID=UPI0007C2AF35|nr:glycosyltransferase [Oleiphilus sp. HI0067]KZX84981.1 hypothetical protein A3715_03995 [Oleiphilus sp. HI0009]KZY68399.1 hypothetical protein A3739_11160 [Oleiphilus sp. HI0067]
MFRPSAKKILEGLGQFVKKIVFILPNLNSGGAERVAINFLAELERYGADLTLLLLQPVGTLRQLVPPCVKVKVLDVVKVRDSIPAVYSELNQIKPDVVYTTHSRITPVIGSVKWFSRLTFTYIARVPNNPIKELAHGVYGRLRSRIFGWGYRRADIVIAQTSEMREACVQLYGLSEGRVCVIHNSLNTANIHRCLEGTVSPFDQGELPIVALGRLAPQKNFCLLVHAFHKISNENSSVKLYILGDDHGQKQEIERLVTDFKLDDRVVLLGLVSNPYPFIANARVFAMSSDYEGFPNALLESYYLNTPIATTKNCDVIEQLVTDGKNGYLAEVGDVDGLALAIKNSLQLDRQKIHNSLGVLDTEISDLFFSESSK